MAIIQNYDREVISILLDKSGTKETFYEISSPLDVAVNNPDILEFLLKEKQLDPNQQNSFGKTAIFGAIQENNIKAVEILLKYGAKINTQTLLLTGWQAEQFQLSAYQRTPLIYAAWQSDLKMIEFLIKNSAVVNSKDSNGKTALDYLEKNEFMNRSEKGKVEKYLGAIFKTN